MPALPSPTADARVAAVAAEAVHTVNNAHGLLIGAESLLEREGAPASGGTRAEALGCVRAAATLLGQCADALNILAIGAEDLLAAAYPPADLLSTLEQLCGQHSLELRWDARELPRRDLGVDADIARWLASCAVCFVRRGIGRGGQLRASARAEGEAFVLALWCERPPGSPPPKVNLSALALQGRRDLLSEAGIGIDLAEQASELSVKLTLPLLPGPDPEKQC